MGGIEKGITVFRNLDFEFEKQLKNSNTKRQIAVDITLKNNEIHIQDEDNNSISLKINELENLAIKLNLRGKKL